MTSFDYLLNSLKSSHHGNECEALVDCQNVNNMNMKPGGKLGYQIPRPDEGSKMTALWLAPVFNGIPHQHYPAIGRDGKNYT